MDIPDEVLNTALAECAAEPVHIPGRIQAHGAMIAVHPADMQICFASESTKEHLGIEAQALLSDRLSDHFDGSVRHDIMNAVRFGEATGEETHIGAVMVNGRNLWCSTCPADGFGIIQFEPFDDDALEPGNALSDLSLLTSQIRDIVDEEALFEVSTQILRIMTGYDRVLIYRFNEDGTGTVAAEAVTSSLEPWIGLNFPKWDVPEQARAIMKKIPMRYIADVNAVTSPMLKGHSTLPDLDMTAATLRGVSEVHLQYLRNSGHHGTFSIHLMNEGRVWGVILLLHATPRRPGVRQRQVCVLFARLLETKIAQITEAERLSHLVRADALRKNIANSTDRGLLEGVFEQKLLNDLRIAMGAEGAAVVLNDNLVTSGKTPAQSSLRTILAMDDQATDVFQSSALEMDAPELAVLCGPEFPGMLLVPLPDHASFAFFRTGRDQTVAWAGAPEKALKVIDGRTRLTPRGSFAKYQVAVNGTAKPWEPHTLKLAEDLWALLVTAERRELIEKTNRQQSLLINELNHRVRNILALIRSLSQQTLSHNGSIQSYVKALEARIAAVAAAHDLGAEKGGQGATLGQIIEVEAKPYNENDDRVMLDGDDAGIPDDLAPLFALVIHELMTNAVKYGALSGPVGKVTVSLQSRETGLEMLWREVGGPAVASPTKQTGFGMTLIRTSVPYELGGTVDVDFQPAGLQVSIFLPKTSLLARIPLRSMDEFLQKYDAPEDLCATDVTNGNCLLVEDNFIVSLDTMHVLNTLGFSSVETAPTVKDALAKIDQCTPSFAVLDVNLGGDVTSKLVATKLKNLGVPFVFVTGYGENSPIGEDFPGTPILKKPLRADEMSTKISEFLQ